MALQKKNLGIVKNIFIKAKQSGKDPYIAILEYRNCPLECGYSPNQLLYSRKTKSILPITDAQLKPATVDPKIVFCKIQRQKEKQKQYYDRLSKPLPGLNVNEYVRMQIGKKWFPAKVIKIHDDHSYIVQTKDGATYRCNRTLLSKTPEKFPGIADLALDILQAPDNSETRSPNDPQPVEPRLLYLLSQHLLIHNPEG